MGEEEPVDGEKVFIVRESSGALPYYSAEYSFHPPSFGSGIERRCGRCTKEAEEFFS